MSYVTYGEKLPCIICGKESIARKLCRKHYNFARNSGTLNSYPKTSPDDIFETRIKKTDTCWLWMGTRNSYGYGIVLLPGEKPVRAHRFSYEKWNGEIPDGMVVMHICDNPQCVNPNHLRLGTKADNNKDTAIKRRHNYGLDHWNGRLSDEQIAAIRADTRKQIEIAREYGVHQSHISRIKRFHPKGRK